MRWVAAVGLATAVLAVGLWVWFGNDDLDPLERLRAAESGLLAEPVALRSVVAIRSEDGQEQELGCATVRVDPGADGHADDRLEAASDPGCSGAIETRILVVVEGRIYVPAGGRGKWKQARVSPQALALDPDALQPGGYSDLLDDVEEIDQIEPRPDELPGGRLASQTTTYRLKMPRPALLEAAGESAPKGGEEAREAEGEGEEEEGNSGVEVTIDEQGSLRALVIEIESEEGGVLVIETTYTPLGGDQIEPPAEGHVVGRFGSVESADQLAALLGAGEPVGD